MELHRHTWMLKIAMIAVLGIVLTACGGGDDDADPTATTEPEAAQPTVVDEGEGDGEEVVDLVSTPAPEPESTPGEDVPVNTDMSSPDMNIPVSTPAAGNVATPPDTGAATEAPSESPEAEAEPTEPDTMAATPEPTTAGEEPVQEGEPAGTPVSEDEATGDVVTGDGTTGAVEASNVAATPEASPVASPAAQEPDTATPAAPTEPVVVEGCEVATVPPFTGEATVYLLSVDVNFRAGPGADCDQIGDGPLGAFTPVEVIGGPVMRAGDEEFQWVQVQVGETTGWLAFEFLEPADE